MSLEDTNKKINGGMHKYSCVEARSQDKMSSSVTLHLIFETKSLSLSLILPDWLGSKLQEICYLCLLSPTYPQVLRLDADHFYTGPRLKSSLPTEPSP